MISRQCALDLQYFVGKVCTIMTQPIALGLSEDQFAKFCTMRIDSIDEEVLWGTDLVRKTKQMFFLPVVGIVEEELVTEGHPEYEKMVQTYETRMQSTPPTRPTPPARQHINVDELKQKADELKSQIKETPNGNES